MIMIVMIIILNNNNNNNNNNEWFIRNCSHKLTIYIIKLLLNVRSERLFNMTVVSELMLVLW